MSEDGETQPSGVTRRYRASVVLALVGLALLTFGTIMIVRHGTEASRLRRQGVAVTAEVAYVTFKTEVRIARYQTGRKVPDKIFIRYQYQGMREAEVRCGDCPPAGGELRLWVDPRNPQHFATEYGDLDLETGDSRFLWWPALAGAILVFAGARIAYRTWTASPQIDARLARRHAAALAADLRGPGPRTLNRRGKPRRRRRSR